MLENEYEFYGNNRSEIRKKFLGKHIVIVGNQVIASYDNLEDAYKETIKTYSPGSFMLHHVPETFEGEIGHI
ncbi:MAG: DUF5678 domain-containing protein [Treponema sp.]|nr:DUF5678 domain-containing protein [Treponema sp.]